MLDSSFYFILGLIGIEPSVIKNLRMRGSKSPRVSMEGQEIKLKKNSQNGNKEARIRKSIFASGVV